MKLTKEMLVKIYKTYNQLMGFSSQKADKINTKNCVEIINGDPNVVPEPMRNNAIAEYLAYHLYKNSMGEKNFLDDLFSLKEFAEDDEIIEAPQKDDGEDYNIEALMKLKDEANGIVRDDDDSVLESSFIADEHFKDEEKVEIQEANKPTKKQIEKLKEMIKNDMSNFNVFNSIDENGHLVKEKVPTKFTPKDFGMENLYKVTFSFKNALGLINRGRINDLGDIIEQKVALEYEDELSPAALNSVDALKYAHVSNSNQNEININVKINSSKKPGVDIQNYKINRAGNMEAELAHDIELYYAQKQVLDRKGFGRYFNPFNWKKIHRENKHLRDFKNQIKEKYGLGYRDWKNIEKVAKVKSNSTIISTLDSIKDKTLEQKKFYNEEKVAEQITLGNYENIKGTVKNVDIQNNMFLDKMTEEYKNFYPDSQIGAKEEEGIEI